MCIRDSPITIQKQRYIKMKKKLLFATIILVLLAGILYYISSVSYTHLDVYKRQFPYSAYRSVWHRDEKCVAVLCYIS